MTLPRKLVLVLCALPLPARADTWVSAEAPAAFAISDPQTDVFMPGIMPSVGLYHAIASYVSVGVRGRAGVLADGGGMWGTDLREPGYGGLASLGVGVRFGTRAWFEVVGGGGVTGDDLVTTGEIGVGWHFDAGKVQLGPSVRYLVVAAPDRSHSLGDAGVVLAGVELTFGGRRKRAAPPPAIEVAADDDHLIDVDAACDSGDQPCAPPDRDGDGIADADDRCPDEAEVVNGVDDRDGCPDTGPFVVIDDRIVLEERVLFDVNRARIKSSGRKIIGAIAAMISEHPEWAQVSIEGHADIRGKADFNDWLSDTRASRVSNALAAAGVSAGRLSWVGYGASRPRDPGLSEAAHARNRRVEFVISRHREVAP